MCVYLIYVDAHPHKNKKNKKMKNARLIKHEK